MFGAFLGYNPIETLLGPTLKTLPASHAATLTGHSFFPNLIAVPFTNGLHAAFDFAIVAMLVAAGASWLRGPKPAVSCRSPDEVPRPARAEARHPRPPCSRPHSSSATKLRAWPEPDRLGPARVVTISGSYGAGGELAGARPGRSASDCPSSTGRSRSGFRDRLGVPLDAVFAHDEQAQGALARSLLTLTGDPGYFGIVGLESPLAVDEDAVRKATETLLWEFASGPGGVVVGRAGAVVLARAPTHSTFVWTPRPQLESSGSCERRE